jgi:hypothetical protein
MALASWKMEHPARYLRLFYGGGKGGMDPINNALYIVKRDLGADHFDPGSRRFT